MSQNIHKFIVALAEDRFADADALLKTIVTEKLAERIRNTETELDEGLFDRLAAKGAGVVAKTGAAVKNFGTKFGGAAGAAKSAVSGDFRSAANKLSSAQDAVDKNDPNAKAKQAKLDSIAASIQKDLESLFPSDPGVQDVLDALKELGASNISSATPPPLPHKGNPKRPMHPFSKIGKGASTPAAKSAPKPVAKKATPAPKPVAKKATPAPAPKKAVTTKAPVKKNP